MNINSLKNKRFQYLITKESGETGGELQKVQACQECGVKILAIKRPVLNYGISFHAIEELIKYIAEPLESEKC